MTSGFCGQFERSVLWVIGKFGLASKKEKVVVACSGGKDSTSVLHILHKNGYDVEALHIDLGMGEWSVRNRENITDFCDEEGIKLQIASTRDYFGSSVCYIKSMVQAKEGLTSCAVCGVIKKWVLNKKARGMGAKKLATGHNLDDEARTFVMNIANGNPELCLLAGPIRGEFGGKLVPRIKPLYFMPASKIRRYSREMKFPVLYERCPCSKGSFGRNIYEELERIDENFPMTRRRIVGAFLGAEKNTAGTGQVQECTLCGEPSRGSMCRTCTIFLKIRGT